MAAFATATDLTGYARIRNAALELFAERGASATSVRDIARAAAVSPGLVQHYFPTKDALRRAVDDHVLRIAADVFSGLDTAETAQTAAELLGSRILEVVEGSPFAVRYLSRSLVDGEEAGTAVFDAFVHATTAIQRRADAETDTPEARDRISEALNVAMLNVAVVMFNRALRRHLPEPLDRYTSLEGWTSADTTVFRSELDPSGGADVGSSEGFS
ncbi:MAG: TetR/AcrR family transcriptional regulator [Acidimicrobiales bacterium]